jgi:hypothetical protein
MVRSARVSTAGTWTLHGDQPHGPLPDLAAGCGALGGDRQLHTMADVLDRVDAPATPLGQTSGSTGLGAAWGGAGKATAGAGGGEGGLSLRLASWQPNSSHGQTSNGKREAGLRM